MLPYLQLAQSIPNEVQVRSGMVLTQYPGMTAIVEICTVINL